MIGGGIICDERDNQKTYKTEIKQSNDIIASYTDDKPITLGKTPQLS